MNDDLDAFRDDPVVRALTGPATADELAGEEQMLAAFRATPRARSRRRFVGRFGTGAGAIVVVLGLSGGVAAAYSQALPAPVQDAVHAFLGPIGVPAAAAARHVAGGAHRGHGNSHSGTTSGGGAAVVPMPASPSATTAPAAVAATTSPRPTHRANRSASGRPTPSATGPTATPTPSSPTGPTPTGTTSPTASPTATPTPSQTPTYGDPKTWTLSGSSSVNRVLVHGGVGISGRLVTADGSPIPNHWVALSAHVPGTNETRRIWVGNTDDEGAFSTYVSGLNHTTVFLVHAGHGVHSGPVRVVVVPTLATSQTATSDGTGWDVTVTSDGADPGDTVVLLRRENGSWVQVGSGQLDSSGETVFRVPKPASREVHYRVRLEPTEDHARAMTSFTAPSS